ncbi:DUF4335 domain-containing protein [Alkalinema sp. FACHB-956]|uniref:DUF4335 domain-containing protein n=1 Tax=Alkalinema sp. FACHB-956 TaxID=2692768 RepID=UPI001689C360|nr:DUF4335 domain-containing protein [Alkalinema sp. FACHB-956]MBD2325365.1 DUF4335 domain-containing protein [Alkalinema sp. FACHB-956]
MSTIQRQYSLPNCTLILEGFRDMANFNPAELRPVMSLLLNAECHLEGIQTPLVGGREFFESLVTAVSLYAQECLSGVPLPHHLYSDKTGLVQIKRVGPDTHQLTYRVEPSEAGTASEPRVVNLTTVQLFDLVEAIDQFVADTQTLPFWSLNLAPVPKKYAPREIGVKQALPAAIGVSSLALAGAALFAMPTPEFRQPQNFKPGSQPSPTASASASPSPSPSSTAPDLSQLETALDKVPPITDPEEIAKLQAGLEEKLKLQYSVAAQVPEALVYRVSVGKDGNIVGYKDQNEAALKNSAKTPLPSLLVKPVPGQPVAEAIAQYRVTFQPDGSLEVIPWEAVTAASPSPSPSESPSGSPSPSPSESPSPSPSESPSPTPSPEASASPSPTASAESGEVTEITASAEVETLQPKLREQVVKAWTDPLTFNDDLQFRVRVDKAGNILDFQPHNRAARDNVNVTPLPRLGKEATSDQTPSQSFATFKVVFRPNGRLEVSPWHGYIN